MNKVLFTDKPSLLETEWERHVTRITDTVLANLHLLQESLHKGFYVCIAQRSSQMCFDYLFSNKTGCHCHITHTGECTLNVQLCLKF